ncbi:MAG TPA: hypothetical protein VHK27_04860, partial [Gammaproteobacteria bacterium]|nr:hypothetical protein [Gammaproteobacteria bacterium]
LNRLGHINGIRMTRYVECILMEIAGKRQCQTLWRLWGLRQVIGKSCNLHPRNSIDEPHSESLDFDGLAQFAVVRPQPQTFPLKLRPILIWL